MDQGCPHEGTDHRLFGRWGCWLQTKLSMHTERAPAQLLLQANWTLTGGAVQLALRLPPYLAVIIPWRTDAAGKRTYLSLRIGWRWDPYWAFDDGTGRLGGYIFPEAILKRMDHVVL